MTDKIIIGQEEWCSLPELGLPAIKAKINSGTEDSFLHAFNIHSFQENGIEYVHFDIHPIQNNTKLIQSCRAQLIDKRTLKIDRQLHLVIKTVLTIEEKTWDIELILTNRDIAGYRLSLGRRAMAGNTLIDPDAAMCLGEVPNEDINNHYNCVPAPKKGLRILILSMEPECYSTKRILEAGSERGHDIQVVNTTQCFMNISAENPSVHYRGGLMLDGIDAVIPRIGPSLTFYGCALTKQFQNLGAYCLNNSVAIARSRDKLRSLQLLSTKGVPMPVTGFANSPMDTTEIIQMVGGAPLVIKLLEGTQGEGVVLAETAKAAESVINAFKSLSANILVQEFIKEADGKDIRCFVIDNKVVASMQREAAPGEFRANLHLGGKSSAIKITPEERRIAIQAAKIMGLQVAGVDIIRSKKGPMVLEINSSPGLEGIETTTGKDIAGMMIECIERKVRNQTRDD